MGRRRGGPTTHHVLIVTATAFTSDTTIPIKVITAVIPVGTNTFTMGMTTVDGDVAMRRSTVGEKPTPFAHRLDIRAARVLFPAGQRALSGVFLRPRRDIDSSLLSWVAVAARTMGGRRRG